MRRLWYFLIHGCFHTYDIIKEVPYKDEDVDGTIRRGILYIHECRKCGHVKQTKVY